MNRKISWTPIFNSKDDEYELDNDDDFESESNVQKMIKVFNPNNIVSTPFGMFKSDSQMNPLNTRDCYFGNVNFDLTESDIENIIKISGIECLRIISRYCFSIMVGTMFDEDDVLDNIELTLGCDSDLRKKSEIEKKIIDESSEKGEFWLTYLFPNGSVYTEHFENQEQLDSTKNKFIELQRLSEGKIFSPEKNTDE